MISRPLLNVIHPTVVVPLCYQLQLLPQGAPGLYLPHGLHLPYSYPRVPEKRLASPVSWQVTGW